MESFMESLGVPLCTPKTNLGPQMRRLWSGFTSQHGRAHGGPKEGVWGRSFFKGGVLLGRWGSWLHRATDCFLNTHCDECIRVLHLAHVDTVSSFYKIDQGS